MIAYACFRPEFLPQLVALWNRVFSQRRHFDPITAGQYQRRVIDQRAFDRPGLILALQDGEVVGFVHAVRPVSRGILAYRDRRCLANGSVAVLGVAPEFRHQRIGSALLARAEAYLSIWMRRDGLIFAGDYDVPLYHVLEGPRQPFWGDTEMLGILDSDGDLIHFLSDRGYRASVREGTELTMVADLGDFRQPTKPRLDSLGLREVQLSDASPWPGRIGWYPDHAPKGYLHGQFGEYRHEVMALARGDTIASHLEWYPMRDAGRVALFDYQIAPEDRGQGLGSYLLDEFLWRMGMEGFATVE